MVYCKGIALSKFSKIIGHEKMVGKLSQMVDVPQTYLFYGPPSIGKRTIAFDMSRYILCQGSKDDSCICKSCSSFVNDHPDFKVYGRTNKILAADVDQIIDFVSRAPLCSETKVIVLDNVDVITNEAANRLLKTLEESSFTFFLITSQIKSVMTTIQSRCIKIQFDNLSQDDIVNVLWKRLGFELPQARIIGWVGAGSSTDIFLNAGLYIKYRDFAFDFIGLFSSKDYLGQLDFIDKIPKNELAFFIDMVVLILSDMLLLQYGIEDIVNADRRPDIQKLNKGRGEKNLIIVLNELTQVKINSRLNINLNLALKASVIKLAPLMKI